MPTDTNATCGRRRAQRELTGHLAPSPKLMPTIRRPTSATSVATGSRFAGAPTDDLDAPPHSTLRLFTKNRALSGSRESTAPPTTPTPALPAWETQPARSRELAAATRHAHNRATHTNFRAPQNRHRPAALHHEADGSAPTAEDGSPDHA